MSLFKTATDGLNLRRAAELGDNVIAPLPLAHPVTVIDGETGEKWWKVETLVGSEVKRGFVSGSLLRPPATPLREKLVENAVKEWIRFGRGKGKETASPFDGIVGEYWRELNINLDGDDTKDPWSAAFISFIVKKAGYGTSFRYSEGHFTYIEGSIADRRANKADAAFWGFRLNEHKPQIGDLVAGWRKKPVTFDNRPAGFYPSHTDVVVEVQGSRIRTLGGNVANTVGMKTFTRDPDGFVRPLNKLFAIMRNNK